jgi:small subunit ribosomal protein S6
MAIDTIDTVDTIDTLMNYELMYILKPELEASGKGEEIKNLIKKHGGKVIGEDAWGKRNLAYKINGFGEGLYAVLNLELPEKSVSALEKAFNLDDDILRFMFTRSDR